MAAKISAISRAYNDLPTPPFFDFTWITFMLIALSFLG